VEHHGLGVLPPRQRLPGGPVLPCHEVDILLNRIETTE
jgi:hypothetical protein